MGTPTSRPPLSAAQIVLRTLVGTVVGIAVVLGITVLVINFSENKNSAPAAEPVTSVPPATSSTPATTQTEQLSVGQSTTATLTNRFNGQSYSLTITIVKVEYNAALPDAGFTHGQAVAAEVQIASSSGVAVAQESDFMLQTPDFREWDSSTVTASPAYKTLGTVNVPEGKTVTGWVFFDVPPGTHDVIQYKPTGDAALAQWS